MTYISPLLKTVMAALIVTSVVSCNKDSEGSSVVVEQAPDLLYYALTDDNRLLQMNANSSSPEKNFPITGLLSGEKALSIDFRPATGQLYLLSSTSVLYTVDPNTGKVRIVSEMQFDPKITGQYASIDFNPTVDRIRLIGDDGQNLRLHPETGKTAATDGSVNGVSGAMIGAVAYTNSKAGASETVLFDIDATTDKLYKQMPPNDGTLVEVGALGIDFSGPAGFDISANDNTAIAALTVEGENHLYGIDLATGAAVNYGSLPGKVIGIAIPTSAVIYATDENNNLLIVDPSNLNSVVSKTIAGLSAGENIVGIDMRPLTAELFALGSQGNLYTINMASGAAAKISASPVMLEGTHFGFDFNPTVDRIRVVSDAGINLRLNPENGAIAMTDVDLNPGTPMVTAAAYTNNFAGAMSTVLFDIDSETNKLLKQLPPNDGVLVEVGDLGVDVGAANGFDIGGMSGNAWALLEVGGTHGLYTIDLVSGAATKVGDLSAKVHGLAVGLGF